MNRTDTSFRITVSVLGTMRKENKKFNITLSRELSGVSAVDLLQTELSKRGIQRPYQILLRGKHLVGRHLEKCNIEEGDTVTIIPVMGGG